mgnify:FL=1
MDDLKRQRLKLIVRNLKQLLDALESEVFSDVDAYRNENYKELNPTIDDYDEVFDDDDGWTD